MRHTSVEEKLDVISDLLRHILAIELYKTGMTQQVIAKHLKVAKSTVVAMVKGANREGE